LEQIDSRPLTGHQRSIIALAIVANISEFFDMFLIGFAVVQLQKEWSLGGFETGVILACSGLGTVLGAVLWGWAADRMGRRRTFFWCVLIFTVFTLASVFTPTGWWMMLALLRVLVGVGSVLLPYETLAPGDSPMRSRTSGTAFLAALIQMAAILLLLAVCSPVLGVAVYGVVQGAPVWGWVALVAGVVWCGLLLWGGVVFGGRVLDRRGPQVLATIRTWPGHSQPV